MCHLDIIIPGASQLDEKRHNMAEMQTVRGAAPREVMDIKQASEYLGISPDTLYKYANDRFVPAFKLGNRWRFKRAHLDAWMDKQAELPQK